MKTPLLLTIALFFWNIAIHHAQPGTFDPDFNIGTGADFEVYTTTVQPDGKIFIGGAFLHYNESNTNRIARLLNDGALDPEFIIGTGPNNWVYSSAIQSDGKIIIGGEFTQYNGTSINRIARLNPDGTLDNTYTPGLGANDRVNTITIQPDGKIIIGGYFTSYNGTSTSYIARLNEDGTLDSSFVPGLGANNWVYATALQPDGKIIIGGDFTGFNLTVASRIVRVNEDGTVDETFTTEIGASGGIRTVSLQPDGKIIAGGNFATYDGIARNNIARLTANGTIDLGFNPGTGTNNGVYTSAIQPDGKIIITGAFTSLDAVGRSRIARMNTDGSIDNTFDPGTGTDSWIVASALQSDGKLVIGGAFTTYDDVVRNRLGRIIMYCSPSISTDIINACNSYTWIDGVTYTSNNNTATYVIPGAAASGCDSIVSLQLTMLNSAAYTDVVSACSAYTWMDGITYTEDNNTATYVLPGAAANGCDSIITLQLTYSTNATYTDIVTACGPYTWMDGITYTEENNTATYVLPGSSFFGCDSIITLQLTFSTPATYTDVVSACSAYTWMDGNTYTEDNNTATYVLPGAAANGCDSIITLQLTYSTDATYTDIVTACGPYTWMDGITYTEDNNTATYVLPGSSFFGCDSIITLQLTIQTIDNTVTVTGNTLTANAISAEYQWLDCAANYAIIPGATSQMFTPTVSGNYAVYIEQNLCADTSQCQSITISNLIENSSRAKLNIYPNPFSESATLLLETAYPNVTMQIKNCVGETILQERINGNKAILERQQLSAGIYFVQLTQDSKTIATEKIVITD